MPFFVRVRAMSAIALQVEGYGIFPVTGMICVQERDSCSKSK
jgi:hypothetical protein